MVQTERLFLLDGMALAYRAYFSFITKPLINSKGMNTSAIYGFVTALMKILSAEKPDHIAVVFDTKEPTFRHKKYAAYKATREQMPEDMAAQLDKLKEVVRAFNIPLLELPGYEADDIIGTLARRAEKEGVVTAMVTGDKDFMQLVSPLIRMYKPGKGGADEEWVDTPGVIEKFGVPPGQVIEVLGLIGDTSDNIPGVPGIGPKTAAPLIVKYGSIPALYDHLDDIPQKGVREKLKNNRELAFLSRELVTIDTAVPLVINFHELKAAKRDTSLLVKLFGELEFKGLAGRLRDTEEFDDTPEEATPHVVPAEPVTITDVTTDAHEYLCVTSEKELKALCKELAKAKELVFDTETTSKDSLDARLVGVSLCIDERKAWYVPVRADGDDDTVGSEGLFGASTEAPRRNSTDDALDAKKVLGALRPILENPSIRKIGQNIKYDILVMMNHGIAVAGTAFDTMVASYILRADGQHNLDALAMEWLQYRMVPFEEMVGKGKNARHITEVPLEEITRYSAEDADITRRIYDREAKLLDERKLRSLVETIEFPLIEVLARMEFAGIALDVQYLADMSKEMERQISGLITTIHRMAGSEFNINSTQQLGEILFSTLKLPAMRKTKTGFSTDAAVLESLRGQHPIVDELLNYRQLTKLKSTYVDALPLLIKKKTGRVHTSFNQTVAATGRLSSSDPNLQNIPIRTDIGRSIRKAFIAQSPGTVLMSADYSQIELRVMAHMSGDAGLLEAFRNDEDIHATTAAKVFGVVLADVSRDMRRKAKEVNFGIMYGIGPFGLANRLEITQAEAKDIIGRYFERFPKVKQYINDTIASAKQRGYVETMLGRRRYIAEINSKNQNIRGNAERQAINMPIQGTAADMIKLAMIGIDHDLRTAKSTARMLLQVHDELVLESPEKEVQSVSQIVERDMVGALKLDVPIKVEVGTGRDWLSAH